MSSLIPPNSVLAAAFRKINRCSEGQNPDFSSAEVALLQEYVSMEPQERERTQSHQRFYKMIVDTVAKLPSSAPNREHDRRANHILRKAMQKCSLAEFDHLIEAEIQILKNTKDTLSAKASPSANNTRLLGFLEEELNKIESSAQQALKQQEPVPEATLDSSSAVELSLPFQDGETHQASEFFAGGKREKIDEIAGIAIDIFVRIFEFTGNLIIEGEVPEDVVVIVKGGGALIKGFMFGHIIVDDSLQIDGNIHGGLMLSETGDIKVERILAGSRIIAVKGSIQAQAAENPTVLYAAKNIVINQNLTGGKVYAQSTQVEGDIISTNLHLLKAVQAKHCESTPQTPCCFHFRYLNNSQNFGREVNEKSMAIFRQLIRLSFQAQLHKVQEKALQENLIHLHKIALYTTMSNHTEELSVSDMCNNANHKFYILYLERIAAALQRLLFEIYEMDQKSWKSALTGGVEECQQALKKLEKDTVDLPDSHFQKAKNSVNAALNQLGSISKKIKETAVSGKGHTEPVKVLIKRQIEWLQEINGINTTYAEFSKALDSSLNNPDLITSSDAMHYELQKQLNADTKLAQSQSMKEFLRVLEKRTNSLMTLKENTTLAGEVVKLEKKLQKAGILFRTPILADYSISATSYSKGVEFSAIPIGITIDGLDNAYTLRLEKMNEDGGVYTFNNHTIKKITP